MSAVKDPRVFRIAVNPARPYVSADEAVADLLGGAR